MALPQSWRQLIERIKKHINDGFPNEDYNITENEMLLYIQEALAFSLVGSVYQMAKVEGNLVMPEGFLTTYSLPALQQDNITKEWFTTLPKDWHDNPFHNHFVQFDPSVTDEEILFIGELTLQIAAEKWQKNKTPEVLNQPVMIDLSTEKKTSCENRINQLKTMKLKTERTDGI